MRGAKTSRPRIPNRPNEQDVHIGRLVRARRRELGLTLPDLAERVGITFQQVQNYEVGKSRITIGRLTRIAKALHVPPAFFFGREAKATVAFSKKSHQLLAATGAVRLMSAYDRLPTEQRAAFVVLVEGIANRKACG
jgi:transcriptional regulator with XRE-family HTH domain